MLLPTRRLPQRSRSQLRETPGQTTLTLRAGQADPSGDSRETSIQNAFVEGIVTRGLKWIRDTPLEEMTNNMYMFLQPYIWTSGLSLRARCAACLPVLLTRRLRICSGGSHAGDDRHGQKWAEVVGNRQA